MKRSPVRRVRINSIAIGPPNAAVVVPVYRPRLEIEISHFSASVYDITGNLWWPVARHFSLSIHFRRKAPVSSPDKGFLGMADVAMDGQRIHNCSQNKVSNKPRGLLWPFTIVNVFGYCYSSLVVNPLRNLRGSARDRRRICRLPCA